MHHARTEGAYSLIEIIIYMAVLVLVMVVLVNSIFDMVGSSSLFKAGRLMTSSAQTSLERMANEIQNAITVDIAQSTFNANPGRLTLNTTDSGRSAATVEFLIENSQLKVKKNGGTAEVLVTTGTTVTNLVFRYIDTPASDGVKIEATFQSTARGKTRSESFYLTEVLRRSYND